MGQFDFDFLLKKRPRQAELIYATSCRIIAKVLFQPKSTEDTMPMRVFRKKIAKADGLFCLGVIIAYNFVTIFYTFLANREFSVIAWALTTWLGCLPALALLAMLLDKDFHRNIPIFILYTFLPVIFNFLSIILERVEMPTVAWWVYTTRYWVMIPPAVILGLYVRLGVSNINMSQVLSKEDFDDLT